MASQQPNIDLYTMETPNGLKVTIALEELGLSYKTHRVDISTNAQKEPWFLEINPNGRIPAMTDTFSDGKQIRLFESGSMMQYLVATYDKDHKISFPPGTREFYEMNNWLFWMNAGLGPMQGQSNHFVRYAPQPIEYGMNRYKNETRRLYGVLEKHFKDTEQEYLVANKCTIADMAVWPWVNAAFWAGVEIDEFPTLKAWAERMEARPGVVKGKDIPKRNMLADIKNNPEKIKEIEEKSKAWIQAGMKDDAK